MTTQSVLHLADILLGKGLTVAAAESCTGGLVSDMLTDIPGSSNYFLGSVVAYSNAVKEHILGVRASTLFEQGAVSGETAVEMAEGVRHLLGADIAVSITGIAGPGGGTKEKPVGLTWIGVSSNQGSEASCFHWEGDRRANKRSSAEQALRILLEHVQALPGKD